MNETIRLDVTKNTFRKYIIKAGFNYNIRQYDVFIPAIKRKIVDEIKTSINDGDIQDKIKEIFGTEEISLDILFNYSVLIKFRLSYLERIINEGALDIFFIEETKKKTFSEKVQSRAYTYNCILDSNISDKEKEMVLSFLELNSNTGSNEYISMKNCLNNQGITLSEDKKSILYDNLNKNFKLVLLRNTQKSYIHRLFSIIEIYRNKEMSYYRGEDLNEFVSLFMKGDYLSGENKEDFISLDHGTSFGISFSDFNNMSEIINLYNRLRTRYKIYNKKLLNIFSSILFNEMDRLPLEIIHNSRFDAALSIEENLNTIGVNSRGFDMYKEISKLSYENINDVVVSIGSEEFTIKKILNSYS